MSDIQSVLKTAIANGIVDPSRSAFLLCQASTEIDRLRGAIEEHRASMQGCVPVTATDIKLWSVLRVEDRGIVCGFCGGTLEEVRGGIRCPCRCLATADQPNVDGHRHTWQMHDGGKSWKCRDCPAVQDEAWLRERAAPQPTDGLLREAVMLLFDWDTLSFGRAGDVVRETKAFLEKVGYDPMTATLRAADNGSAATPELDRYCDDHGYYAGDECKKCLTKEIRS